jgi:hypothetical protein
MVAIIREANQVSAVANRDGISEQMNLHLAQAFRRLWGE